MNTSSLTPLEHSILSLLLRETDEKKALSADAIVTKLGIGAFGATSKKYRVLDIVAELRKKRYPICSSSRGFFYARQADSLRKFIDKLQKSIEPTMQLIEALNDAFENVGEPEQGNKMTIGKYVRTENGTVALRQFEIGDDGQPIIPPDVTLV